MAGRIQRKRSKGWRMPSGAVYAGRPTEWGNPWPVGKPGPDGAVMPTAAEAVKRFARAVDRDASAPTSARIREELRGRDLVCWCPLDEPCHADVLIEIANRR